MCYNSKHLAESFCSIVWLLGFLVTDNTMHILLMPPVKTSRIVFDLDNVPTTQVVLKVARGL